MRTRRSRSLRHSPKQQPLPRPLPRARRHRINNPLDSACPKGLSTRARLRIPSSAPQESRTYVTEDGLSQTFLSTGSLNYRDDQKLWQPIDNTVVASEREGYGHENAANRFKVYFPEDIATTPVVFESDDGVVTFALPAAKTSEVTTEANSVTYHSVAPDVDLTYYVTADGLAEDITIHSPGALEAAIDLRFEVATSEGLSSELSGSGAISFSESSGEVVFSFAPPFMTDAAGAEAGGDLVAFDLDRTSSGSRSGSIPAWPGSQTPSASTR